METFDQADAGYPEEAPPGSEPGGGESEVRERSEQRAEDEQRGAPDNDDGKATGNPNT